MNKIHTISTLLLLVMASVSLLKAQHRCGFEDHKHSLLKAHPELEKSHQDYLHKTIPALERSYKKYRKSSRTNTLSVPVVVHVIHDANESVGEGANISAARIQAQIDVLNEDFNARNANFDRTPSRFSANKDNPNISFCLATIDPDGLPTEGITRRAMEVTGSDIDDTNIELEIKPATSWDPDRYYNIWVLPIPGTDAGGGVTGYAYLPSNFVIGNESYDGSVVDYRWFGGPGFSQSGYKTLTHETGHYLGLYHPFNGDDCGMDDGISDTPNMEGPTSDYAALNCNSSFPIGPTSCSEEHLYINYMDYTRSNCYTAFTPGQVGVMRGVLEGTASGFGSRSQLLSNASSACVNNQLDVGITDITSPEAMLCEEVSEIVPRVVLANFGTVTLNSAVINYSIDGQATGTFNWTGSLDGGSTIEVALPGYPIPQNNHTLAVSVSTPNGEADQNTGNNNQETTVAAPIRSELPFENSFEQGSTPSFQDQWTVVDPNNDGFTWTTVNGISSGGGNRALVMDHYSPMTSTFGQMDFLVSPTINLNDNPAAVLSFDVAYARYDGGGWYNTDSLVLMASTDCGNNYSVELFRDGGATLETGTATDGLFSPGANEWRTVEIDLTQFDNAESVTLVFISFSGWGNRMFLDNINIEATNITPCPDLGASAATTPVSCHNGSDGTATISVQNGETPYTFDWSNNANGHSADDLAAGTYTVFVYDGRQCPDTVTFEIGQPEALQVQLSKTDQNYAGTNNGTVNAQVTGGTPPYQYEWNTGSQEPGLVNVAPGTYSLLVVDNNGCEQESAITVEGVNCSNWEVRYNTANVLCAGEASGSISILVEGENVSQLDYNWSVDNVEDCCPANLEAGTYTVTVTNEVGCTQTTDIQISEPEPLSVNTSVQHIECGSTGSVLTTVAGGVGPYEYEWQDGSSESVYTTTEGGPFSLVLEDSNGCLKEVSGTVINNGPGVEIQGQKSNVACAGGQDGTVVVEVSSGTPPYTYNWSHGPQTAEVNGLSAGVYTVQVIDSKECEQTTSFTILEPSAMQVGFSAVAPSQGEDDGILSAEVTGGTTPYRYTWSNGEQGAVIDGLAAGTYGVTVTDGNGCETIGTYEFEVSTSSYEVPTGWQFNLYPNPMGSRGVIACTVPGAKELEIIITDINGREMYRNTTQGDFIYHDISTHDWTSGVYLVILRNGPQSVIATWAKE